MTYYLHHVPGRLRVQIPVLRQRPARFRRVENLLGGIDGLESLRFNDLTGSVLIQYDPDRVEAEAILDRLKDQGLFDERCAVNVAQRIETSARGMGKTLRRAAVGWTVGRVLEANGLSFLAALI